MSKKEVKDASGEKGPKMMLSSKPGPIKLNYDDFKDLIDKSNEKVISQNQSSIQSNFAEI